MKKDQQQTEAIRSLWLERAPIAQKAKDLGESFTARYKDPLANLARNTGIPERYVQRQFLLHCPRYTLEEIRTDKLLEHGSRLHLLLMRRAIDHQLASDHYEEKISVDKDFAFPKGHLTKSKEMRVESVPWQQARVIESQLHYMQSFRANATRRLGLFHGSDAWPFCYTSVAVCDRSYLHEAVCTAIEQEVSPRNIAVLSRIYASRHAPKNSISFLISRTMRMLREEGFSIYITASNPYLGFSSSSIAASNFVPFARCPVAYNYDSMGSYQTRRNLNDSERQVWDAPPNFIFVKSLEKPVSHKVRTIKNIVNVSPEKHSEIETGTTLNPEDFQNTLMDLRISLEGIWDESTRYHRTEFNPGKDPISKGQCGVTSAYLARMLEREGHKVMFCEGDVAFAGFEPIEQHCWLRLVVSDRTTGDDIIVDITADQSGFSERVICDTIDNLQHRGIDYQEKYSVTQSQVGVDHVKSRLRILQGGLRKQNEKRRLN